MNKEKIKKAEGLLYEARGIRVKHKRREYMYYKIELFRGCLCHKVNGVQNYGPEFYYSGIIHCSTQNSSWNTFCIAKDKCRIRLEKKLNELQSIGKDAAKEISLTKKLISRLISLNESIVNRHCSATKRNVMSI